MGCLDRFSFIIDAPFILTVLPKDLSDLCDHNLNVALYNTPSHYPGETARVKCHWPDFQLWGTWRFAVTEGTRLKWESF
jgi:hypothetical protein